MKRLRMLIGSIALIGWIILFLSPFLFLILTAFQTWNFHYLLLAIGFFFVDLFIGNAWFYPKIIQYVEKEA